MSGFRKYLLTVVSLALLFLSAGAGFSEELADVTKKMKEQERKITDVTMIGEVTYMRGNQKGLVAETVTYRKGNMFRNDVIKNIVVDKNPGTMKMNTVMIYDGNNYWSISSVTGKKKVSKETAQPYHLYMDYTQHIFNKGQLLGMETVNKRFCYKILVKGEDKFPKDDLMIWIDKNTSSVEKIEDLRVKSYMIADDYRKIRDTEFPFKTELYSNGKMVSVTNFKSVEVNKSLSDDLFDPDKVNVEGPQLNLGVKSNMSKGLLKRIRNERVDQDQRRDRDMQNTGVQGFK